MGETEVSRPKSAWYFIGWGVVFFLVSLVVFETGFMAPTSHGILKWTTGVAIVGALNGYLMLRLRDVTLALKVCAQTFGAALAGVTVHFLW